LIQKTKEEFKLQYLFEKLYEALDKKNKYKNKLNIINYKKE